MIQIFLLLAITTWGQRSSYPTGSEAQSSNAQQILQKEKPIVRTYTLTDKNDKEILSDTSLNGFEIYAPHRKFESAALTLGNLGSSAARIIFKERNNIYTDIGYHQYDIYRVEAEELKFYELNRPYNELYFSPQAGQQNFQVGARFSRNLSDNMNLSLEYKRINQEGFYSGQETKMTSFGLGLSKLSEKHDMYLSFIANNFNEGHNGGVSVNVDSLDQLSPIYRNQRGTIDTYLENATSRHQYFSYSADNFWHAPDSPISIHHHARLEHGYYRFSDEDVNSQADSIVYLSYLSNDRGLRVVNKFRRLTNELALKLKHKTLGLYAGATHNYLYFNNSNDGHHIHDASINGGLDYNLRDIGSINAKTRIAVGENIGNFQFDTKLKLLVGKFADFTALFHSSRYDPFLIQEMFVVTNETVFQNNLSKTNEISLSGELHLDKLNLSLFTKTGILDNVVYFDDRALPFQTADDINYFQLGFKHSLFWKFIGLDNEFIYQTFNTNVYQLPRVYSRHNIYLQNHFFKKNLKARLGIQYYNIDYNGAGLAFMPANGAFYPSKTQTSYYPITEVYLNCQVERFRIFFRIDNFSDMILPEVHYQVANYPQFDAGFRMGVNWIFFD